MTDWITAWYVSWPLHIACFGVLGAIGMQKLRATAAEREAERKAQRKRELDAAKLRGRP